MAVSWRPDQLDPPRPVSAPAGCANRHQAVQSSRRRKGTQHRAGTPRDAASLFICATIEPRDGVPRARRERRRVEVGRTGRAFTKRPWAVCLSRELSPRKVKGAHAGACLGARFVRLWSECSSSAVLSSGVRHLSFASSVVFDVACYASDLARACRPVAPGAPG